MRLDGDLYARTTFRVGDLLYAASYEAFGVVKSLLFERHAMTVTFLARIPLTVPHVHWSDGLTPARWSFAGPVTLWEVGDALSTK